MKKTAIIIAASLVVLSCGSLVDRIDDRPTFQQVNTAASIVGYYSMTRAEWEYEIDLTAGGEKSRDILSQLKEFGFHGFITIDGESVFDMSHVMDSQKEDMTGQINLFAPLFRIKKDNNTGEFVPENPLDGKCPMEMEPYQFHYKIWEDGHFTLNAESVWDVFGDTVPYYDVRIDMTFGGITLSARTLMFNRASNQWQEGHIKCEYVRR